MLNYQSQGGKLFSYVLCWQCHLSASALCCSHFSVSKEMAKNKCDMEERGTRSCGFIFIGRSVLSFHFPLVLVQALNIKGIAEVGRGGPQMPEERKSGNLLRIRERLCLLFFFKSLSMPLFSSLARF